MFQARRGLNREYPENTIPAILGAVFQGYASVEVDVNLTRDGKVVLLHDETINRTARNKENKAFGEAVRIQDITYEEALSYDFGGWFSNKFQNVRIPLLSEVLALAKKKGIGVNIDSNDLSFADPKASAIFREVQEIQANTSFVCRSLTDVQSVLSSVPEANISYYGEITEASLKALSQSVNRERLTVWLQSMEDAPQWSQKIKSVSALGIRGINNYTVYDDAISRFAPDMIETDGCVKPAKREGVLADVHMHSRFSKDSKSELPDICESAKEKKVSVVCITDHVDFIPNDDMNQLVQIRKDACAAIRDMDRQVENLDVLLGVEISGGGTFPEKAKVISECVDYDQIIGSGHGVYYLEGKEFDLPASACHKEVEYISTAKKDFTNSTEEELIRFVHYYYDSVMRLLKRTQVDVMAHLVYPFRYINGKYKRNIDWMQFLPQIDSVLDYLIAHGIALEVNTSRFETATDDLAQYDEIIRRYAQKGGYLITLGSDAHKNEQISHSFGSAIEMLKRNGIRNLFYYKNRFPIQYTIV